MGEDEADGAAPREGAGKQQACNGLGSVEGKFECRGGSANAMRRTAGRLGRVEIDYCLPAIKLLEHRVAGILTAVEADARRYIQGGYRSVAVGTDIGLLARNADALAAAFRKI